MNHYVVWFDLPVIDLERACKFYAALLDVELKRESFPGAEISVFPHKEGQQVAGCLVQAEGSIPSQQGMLVYFNVDKRLDDALSKVKENGGQILRNKHEIGEYGYRAIILDSEGNRIALHSC